MVRTLLITILKALHICIFYYFIVYIYLFVCLFNQFYSTTAIDLYVGSKWQLLVVAISFLVDWKWTWIKQDVFNAHVNQKMIKNQELEELSSFLCEMKAIWSIDS